MRQFLMTTLVMDFLKIVVRPTPAVALHQPAFGPAKNSASPARDYKARHEHVLTTSSNGPLVWYVVRMIAAAVTALTWLCEPATPQLVGEVELTAKHVEGFVSAQRDLAAIAKDFQRADKPDPDAQARYESAAKNHGFKTFAEYDAVSASISLIMSYLDWQTGAFREPSIAIRKEIDEIEADTRIPHEDKKKMLSDLNGSLKLVPAKIPKKNIEIVRAYRRKIEAALP